MSPTYLGMYVGMYTLYVPLVYEYDRDNLR